VIHLFNNDVSRLRKELADRQVKLYVSDAALREFIGAGEKEVLADFIAEWTMIDAEEAHRKYGEALSHIASKHALPRAWRHAEPAARLAEHPTPTYLYWASAS
jgi:hypothetical protein